MQTDFFNLKSIKYTKPLRKLIKILSVGWLFLSAATAQAYTVGILVFEGVQIIDFAAPYEVFGHAGFDVVTVSKEGKALTTTMGLNITPDHSFTTMPEFDALIIPGGDISEVTSDPTILNWLTQQTPKVQHMLSVCNGAFALAEAGLLDGLSATTFHRAIDSLEKNYPAISIERSKRFVDNGRIITSAGLSSGMDAALHLVSRVKGIDSARTVAMHIEYDWDPEQGFVRANMADKYLPDVDYNWPDDAKFSRGFNYGDEHAFKRSYSVTTSASVSALQNAVKAAMDGHAMWQYTQNNETNSLLFIGKGNMVNWVYEVSFSKSNKPGSNYLITSSVTNIVESASELAAAR